ncbi:LysR family transcriptional regulator [Robbsia sp. KACC 23696]|uniref:LysR substrate-binding domain-containing protein n=1 Tax=Robbsia sp. KACC 23696 TaxID=3149231 RepID=UPI00325B1702
MTIFRVVAAELSITRAAARLGRVPSNVTTRIQQLEAELGAPLFIRTGKRLSLSPAGQLYIAYADRMLALADEAARVVSGAQRGDTLRIGSMEATAASRLPPILRHFGTANPETRVEVVTAPSRQLLQKIQAEQLDCAFLALPSSDEEGATALAAMGLTALPTWNEELLLLTPPRDCAARTPEQIGTRALSAFGVGCAYRAIAEHTLSIPTSSEWRVQETNSYHAMLANVAAGAAVALVPRSVTALGALATGLGAISVGMRKTWLVRRDGDAAPASIRFHDAVLANTQA